MPQVVLRVISKPSEGRTRAGQASCEQASGAAPARPARRAVPVHACRPHSAGSGTHGRQAQACDAPERGPAEGFAETPAERERAGSGSAATAVPGGSAPLAALRAAKPYRPAFSPQQSPAGAASPGPGVAPGMSHAPDADAALGSVADAAMLARTSQLLGACAAGLGAANGAWAEHGSGACQADEQPGSSRSSSFTQGGLPEGPLRSTSSSFTHGGAHADPSLGSGGNSQGSANGSHADLDCANGAALGELAWTVRDAGGGAQSPASGLGSASPVHAARAGAGDACGGCPAPGAQLAANAAANGKPAVRWAPREAEAPAQPEALRPHCASATAQPADDELCVIRATSSDGGTGRVLLKPRPAAMDALFPAAAAPSGPACSPLHDATEGDVPAEAWKAARQRLALSGARAPGSPQDPGLGEELQAHSNGCRSLGNGAPEAQESPVPAQCQHATAQAAEAAAAEAAEQKRAAEEAAAAEQQRHADEECRRRAVAEAVEQKRAAEKAAAERAAADVAVQKRVLEKAATYRAVAAAVTERQRRANEEHLRRAAAQAAEQKRAADKAAAEQAAAAAAAAKAADEEHRRRAAADAAEQKRAAERAAGEKAAAEEEARRAVQEARKEHRRAAAAARAEETDRRRREVRVLPDS